jgi:hypothetical protein
MLQRPLERICSVPRQVFSERAAWRNSLPHRIHDEKMLDVQFLPCVSCAKIVIFEIFKPFWTGTVMRTFNLIEKPE